MTRPVKIIYINEDNPSIIYCVAKDKATNFELNSCYVHIDHVNEAFKNQFELVAQIRSEQFFKEK